jgi:hypothetical protein
MPTSPVYNLSTAVPTLSSCEQAMPADQHHESPVPLGPIVAQVVARLQARQDQPGVSTMPLDAITETVALLESLSRRATELAAVLPSLELLREDLATLAGEVQRVNARLADAEERLAFAGPAER